MGYYTAKYLHDLPSNILQILDDMKNTQDADILVEHMLKLNARIDDLLQDAHF